MNYYIIFLFAFTWGILIGYKKVFPYNIMRSIAKEVIEFYKGGKDLKDISIVDKIKKKLSLLKKPSIIYYDFKDHSKSVIKKSNDLFIPMGGLLN